MNCTTTVVDAIRDVNIGGVTTNATGCTISGTSAADIDAAVAIASRADVVVLALGIDRTVEHEG
jgi:hypothetical protein